MAALLVCFVFVAPLVEEVSASKLVSHPQAEVFAFGGRLRARKLIKRQLLEPAFDA